MQAELKTKEREEVQEILIEEVEQDSLEIEEIFMTRLQNDLETKLIAEIQEKLRFQQLENKIIEDEVSIKKWQEETEEQEKIFQEYDLEIGTAYSKDKEAYRVKQTYEQIHGNQIDY